MKCTDNEWKHCRVEKMECDGCYYNNIIQKQIFFEDRFGNILKLGELQQFEINNTDERDDAVDSLKYITQKFRKE